MQSLQSLPKLSNSQLRAIIVSSFFLSLLFGFDNKSSFFIIGLLCAFIMILSLFFIPKKLVIYPLFIIMVNMLDLNQTLADEAAEGTKICASVWQIKIGNITPAYIIIFIVIVILLRLFKIGKNNAYIMLFFYFFLFETFISIYFGFLQESFSRFIADAKVGIFFCSGLVIFDSYYKRYPNQILISTQVLICLIAGHFILDLIYIIAGVSVSDESGFKVASIDSGKGVVTIFVFYAFSELLNIFKNLLNKRNIMVYLAIAIISIYMIIAYQTRWLIVSLLLGCLTTILVVGINKSFKLIMPLGFFFFFSLPILIQLLPNTWEAMFLRFGFIENLNGQSSFEDVDLARAGAIYNSTGLLLEKNTFLTGMGYGSWYNEKFFPMPVLNLGAFDADSLNNEKYYRVHDFTFHFLFKFGIIGLFLYIGAFFKPLKQIWKLRKPILKHKLSTTISVVLFGIAPMIITYMWFTGKGLLFSALFICMAYEWAKIFRFSFEAQIDSGI